MTSILLLILINTLAFWGYGLSCIFSKKMEDEFIRFGLTSNQRLITGIAQILGATGLIVGYFSDMRISLAAAIGLCLLMFLGFRVRLRIKDTLLNTLPSFFFMSLNLVLTYAIVLEI